MNKAIATTQQGDKTIFMIGDFQATLWLDTHTGVWTAEYFKKNRAVVTSSNRNHPIMPNSALDQPRAEAIVRKVIGCLNSGHLVTKEIFPIPVKSPKRPPRTRNKTHKVVDAYQILDRLLNLVDDSSTVLVPMGKPAALKLSKVRVVDSEGETVCEIPYPIFENLL
jgi:hypothetical protein